MKHTPGPWTLASGSLGVYVMAGEREISSTIGSTRQDLDNAKLIAAAPELLAALEAIAGIAGNLPDEFLREGKAENHGEVMGSALANARHIARTAIRKARGEK